MNPLENNNFSFEPRVIRHSHGCFCLVLSGGSEEVCQFGWTLTGCSGLLCSYATKSKEVVRRTVALGWTLDASAKVALESDRIADDPSWAVEQERIWHEKKRADKLLETEYEAARQLLVESARKKLTPEEFQAVVEEGYDR